MSLISVRETGEDTYKRSPSPIWRQLKWGYQSLYLISKVKSNLMRSMNIGMSVHRNEITEEIITEGLVNGSPTWSVRVVMRPALQKLGDCFVRVQDNRAVAKDLVGEYMTVNT